MGRAHGVTGLTIPPWAREVRPAFSRVLAREEIYLANHSLGRPPDAVLSNIQAFATSWMDELDESWSSDRWLGEVATFRGHVAALLGLPSENLVVTKTSAGQGLRAVLNAFPADRPIRVVTTSGEFDSIDFILRAYRDAGRIMLDFVPPTASEHGVPIYEADALKARLQSGVDLLVISAVYFGTGQVMQGLSEIVAAAHEAGAVVVVDAYHALGVLPFDQIANGADFVIGGCYKYLRGGPGACFLGLHPRIAGDAAWKTVDTGWFAKKDTFSYQRTEHAERWPGGDGWQESTPPIVTAYQANPGLATVRAIGIDQIRAHNLKLQAHLIEGLQRSGVPVFAPQNPLEWGAFVLVPHPGAGSFASALKGNGVNTDARGGFVRLGPDFLNTPEELEEAAQRVALTWRQHTAG